MNTQILLGLILILLIWNSALTYFYFASIRHYKRLKGLSSGVSLDEILQNILIKSSQNETQLSGVEGAISDMKSENLKTVSKIGLFRFNPYDDLGGDMSFSLALLDKNDTGVVISSLHGRSGTRVYCKDIKSGEKASHELSEEERKAITLAKSVY